MSDLSESELTEAAQRRARNDAGGTRMKLWWLSFVDVDRHRNIGAAIVEAEGFIEAVRESRRLGCNPGGEVMGCELHPSVDTNAPRNKLLTRKEWEETGVTIISMKEAKALGFTDGSAPETSR